MFFFVFTNAQKYLYVTEFDEQKFFSGLSQAAK